jgi:hypothetical protein
LTASRRNLFFLQASLSQLEILRAMDMRSTYVQAAIAILEEEIERISGDRRSTTKKGKKSAKAPEGRVFLFAGYMVDHPGKFKKTFPANKEREIRHELSKVLDRLGAGPEDLAITAGLSAGSELVFAELCAERGIKVDVHMPLPESKYIKEFVSPGGEQWVDRFYKICSHPLVDEYYQLEQVGEHKEDDDLYERNNRWALYSSLVRGVAKVTLVAIWNGVGGRAKDRDEYLTRHMVELMRDTGGKIETINTTQYVYNAIDNALEKMMMEEHPIHPTEQSPGKSRRIKRKTDN